MASCTQVSVTITPNVANATVEADYTTNFTEFDRLTNLGYDVFIELMGDDTGYDQNSSGEDLLAPDDLLASPPRQRTFVRANGRESVDLQWRPADIAWTALDEDPWFGFEEELRALVTVRPYLPTETTRESAVVVLDEIVGVA